MENEHFALVIYFIGKRRKRDSSEPTNERNPVASGDDNANNQVKQHAHLSHQMMMIRGH